MRCRDCCRREVYALAGAILLWIFEIVAIATPWYAVAATQLPHPWDSFSGVYWWGGMEGFYSPPLIGNEREYSVKWGDMKTAMPKDVYMASIAMCFLALFFDTALMFIIFFGQICRNTTRILNMMFCGMFKWIVVIVSFFVTVLVFLSWIIFFAFPSALNDAKMCPGTNAYPVNLFPMNGTCIERLWCDSFANSRTTSNETNWVWGPSVGWVFALICSVFALWTLAIQLTVNTGGGGGGDYENIGDGGNYGGRSQRREREREFSRDRDRERERSYDSTRGGDRDFDRDRERRYDDTKMQRKYNRFDV